MSGRHIGGQPAATGALPRALPPRLDYPMLALGVVAVSFSAIFIRLAHAPSLTIAFYRNAMAVALLAPLALARHRGELRALTRRQLLLAILSGAFLALHFATWIPSLSYTTVAASVVLVTTQPVWTALGGRLFLGQRLPARTYYGIGVALAGAAVISGGDFALSARAAFGDVLALVGAVAAGGYFLVGRNVRLEVGLIPYVSVAYASCAVLLLPVLAVSGTPLVGFPTKTWVLFGLLALIPHVLGHTAFNYLLRYLDPTLIAIAIMGEPVGASVLALAFFGEVPGWTAVLGGVLILAGIYVAVSRQATRHVPAPVQ